MAAIDKTYCTWEQYLILKDWCLNNKLIYDNGEEGSPMDFLYSYNKPYEGEAPVWNTPESFDRWLYYNCPLSFIQERLKIQYPNAYFDNHPIITPETGTRYRGSFKPKYRTRYTWFIDFDECPCGWYYGWDSKIWYHYTSLMPSEIRGCGNCTVRNLTKRKLNRLIKKWKLPIGTKLVIACYGTRERFNITIKR